MRFVFPNSAAWLFVIASVTHAGPPMGDSDGDGDYDLADFARFSNCFSGSNPPTDPACDTFDFSPDPGITLLEYELWTCGFRGPGAPAATIVVDPVTSPTNEDQITLTGLAAGAASVRITGGLQTVTAPTDGCEFSATIGLRPNVVNRLFVTAVFANGEVGPPVGVVVTQDSQSPFLFLDFPAAGAQIAATSTDVAGRVGDTLSGFSGMRVKARVNGAPPVQAAVDIGIGSNGTFFVPSLPLELGPNTIEATAIDALGNFVEKQITVHRVEIPANAARMSVLSGNEQSAPIRGTLPLPIRVQLVSLKGVPLAGKVVTFRVVRSDGRLASSPAGLLPGASSLQVFTDTEGVARAFWRVGGDAGRGNNRVEVTSDNVMGTTLFCASATAGPATQINVGGGNSQRVEAGAPAPEPLSAWVNDSCNPVSGIPVTFTVLQGGGKVNGENAVTLETSPAGHAEVAFVLGLEPGNNVIEANFPGNPNPPAVFTLFGLVRDAKVPTSFSGLVLDNAGQPIQGATCTLVIGGVTLPFTPSDLDGRFRFDNIMQSGPADLHVFGASATHVGGANGIDVPANSYPALRYSVILVPNAENALSTPVLLPRLDPANSRSYSTTQDTELTVAGMEGLKMIVKAGSMRLRIGAQYFPAPNGTVMSLNQVHHDDVPMPLPDGAAPPFAWTLQPGGARFDPPVTIIYPNMSGLPAGAIANFLSFDHDTGKFEIIASGHVTADGATIVTDPGSGISVAGWGCNCPPYSVTGQCCHCNEPCQTCVVGACVPTGNGSSCGSTCCAEGQSCCDGTCCNADQECCNGNCVAPGQTCCENGSTCPADETCCQGTCCGESEECCDGSCCLADQLCCSGGGEARCISALNTCCENGTECFPPEFPMCCGTGCCVADGICCDDECQLPGSTCCFAGLVCSPPTPNCCGDGCCAENAECCNGVCTAPGGHCCDDANFCSGDTPLCCVETCCTAEQQCCNGVCAPTNAVCCEGPGFCPAETPQCCESTCCPSDGVCCNGECHPAGSICCSDGAVCTAEEPQCCHGGCCTADDICCADGCGPAGTQCCGETGCNPGSFCCGAECCPDSQNCCGDVCQPSGAQCCPDGGTCPGTNPICCGENCCGEGSNCCGGACCAGDEVCCNGSCKPAGHVCCQGGSSCPGSQPICCGTSCCTFASVCCGNNCCAANDVCCNGICQPTGTQCCPAGQKECHGNCIDAFAVCCPGGGSCPGDAPDCCGSACCSFGQRCCEGQCVPVDTEECCPDGGSNCDGQCISAGTICCPGGSHCNGATEICCGPGCCPASGSCCDDKCLIAGHICCADGSTCPASQPICCGINCCTPGSNCCGNGNCCAGTDVCCNGLCKPAGHVCCADGTSCPGSQPICCGVNCCTFGSICCGNGNCCAANQVCCNGLCLPPGSSCP